MVGLRYRGMHDIFYDPENEEPVLMGRLQVSGETYTKFVTVHFYVIVFVFISIWVRALGAWFFST